MTFNQKNLTIILNDLYQIDPSLKQHEVELIQLINELIKSKPMAEPDEQFKKRLRSEIIKLAQEIESGVKEITQDKLLWGSSLLNRFLEPALYTVAGILLIALVAVPFLSGSDIENPFALSITQKKDNSFGKLAFSQDVQAGREMMKSDDGLGGGGFVAAPEIISDTVVTEQTQGAKDIAIGMPAPMINYSFVYDGEISLGQGKMLVYERNKNNVVGKSIADFLSRLNFESIDFSEFKNAKVNNLTLTEDRESGYVINIDFDQGVISINQNWQRWELDVAVLNDLKAVDLPSDDKIVAAANKFVKDYGIDVSGYGKPEVQKDWLGYPENQDFVPNTISIVYPLVIEGKNVYEQGGRKSGVNVSVDIRQMKVLSLWNFASQNYSSSLYDTITDSAKVLEFLEKGANRYQYAGAEKTYKIELGEPELVYVKTYNYEDRQTKEFLVPALLFPITKIPDGAYYYQQNIIVPIVKDIFEADANNSGVVRPLIEPMPVFMEAATEIEE